MHRISLVLALMAVLAFSDMQAGPLSATPGLVSQQVTPTGSPLVGDWAASQILGRATLQVAVDDDTATITRRTTRMGSRITYQTDGQEHPAGPRAAYVATYVATWVRSHVLRLEAKSDGTVLGVRTYEVSADGQLLTVTTSGRDANGADTESVIVLERQ